MSLTDGEVAALANQVADLVASWLPDKPSVDIRFEPEGGDDPYRWSDATGWTVYFDIGSGRYDPLAVRLSADDTPGGALTRIFDGLAGLSETEHLRGVAFPPCSPGHTHAAQVEPDAEGVTLRCPDTGDVVMRVTPRLA